MKLKKIIGFTVLMVLLLGIALAGGCSSSTVSTDTSKPTTSEVPAFPKDPATTLTIDKTEYKSGEIIKAHITQPTTYSDNAWVGVVPAEKPHGDPKGNYDSSNDFKFTDNKAAADFEFKAPGDPGNYEVRLFDGNTADSKEVNYVAFTVVK